MSETDSTTKSTCPSEGFVARLYRRSSYEKDKKQKIDKYLSGLDHGPFQSDTETCIYILIDPPVKIPSDPTDLAAALGEEESKLIIELLGEEWTEDNSISRLSHLDTLPKHPQTTYIEVGPRLSLTTASSTNIVSICHSAGLLAIKRVEFATKIYINFHEESKSPSTVSNLFDPMTEEVYNCPIENFDIAPDFPIPWELIDVMGEGQRAIRTINKAMGFAFDDWDLCYYTDIFKDQMKRNPTSVELFGLAQANSEHSRHWFFKGHYVMASDFPDNVPSLFHMVMNTNTTKTTNQNNVIKFSDNSSGIEGYKIPVITAKDPTRASEICVKKLDRDIIFTAETHNFPTAVEPFNGAATGAGGRIRDVQAAGRGGHVVAGTAGYCVGNLLMPEYTSSWESTPTFSRNCASPLSILLHASDGASDYGNKFGEPLIQGFVRTYGQAPGNADNIESHREWVKPIMFSGGIGTIDNNMVNKVPPSKGQLVVKIGGPVYKVGVGGGAASSVQVQGDNNKKLDFGAVQRGDPEMEQKLNRVVRGCLEMKDNPILAIHDQGAGGNANVLQELMEGAGGMIFTKAFALGDPTLTTMEIWSAEYQESNAILIDPTRLAELETLGRRERCPVDVVGVITGDNIVRLIEDNFNANYEETPDTPMHPVNLDLRLVLGDIPTKHFEWLEQHDAIVPIPMEKSLQKETAEIVDDNIIKVLQLPSVSSKRYLVNKVDRSVTGLVAQQQCVGPLHTPLADVAVVAMSHFSKNGAATSIGEQPIKMLVNTSAGARMAVIEALTNLAGAPISDLKDVKCSANWMWPAKMPGEGLKLFRACESMCDLMKKIGVGIDGGKDSLSMASRVETKHDNENKIIKSPGSLVISAYAPCTDILRIITPDLKGPIRGYETDLVWVRVGTEARLAGSAFAQVNGQLGKDVPNVLGESIEQFVEAFKMIQKLNQELSIWSIHDISDGGLITCLTEMAIGGWCGLEACDIPLPELKEKVDSNDDIDLPEVSVLFAEEAGWVLEIPNSVSDILIDMFHDVGVKHTVKIGKTIGLGPRANVIIGVNGVPLMKRTVLDLAEKWEMPSYFLEKQQKTLETTDEEYLQLATRNHYKYKVNFQYNKYIFLGPNVKAPYVPKVAVIREEGSNGDREMAAALIMVGFHVEDVTMTDLLNHSVQLDQYRGICFPGGFSYADVLGSSKGWAASINGDSVLRKELEAWKNNPSTFSLGVCNGCQLMARLGWLDVGAERKVSGSYETLVNMQKNKSGRFESRWSRVLINESKAILLHGMTNSILGVWVANAEGRFEYRNEDVYDKLEEQGCIALRYVDEVNKVTTKFPQNPSGSRGGVAGLVSSCGRHLAIMPHPERSVLKWQWPYIGQGGWNTNIISEEAKLKLTSVVPSRPKDEEVVTKESGVVPADPGEDTADTAESDDLPLLERTNFMPLFPDRDRQKGDSYLRDYPPRDGEYVDRVTAPWIKLFQNAFDWCLHGHD